VHRFHERAAESSRWTMADGTKKKQQDHADAILSDARKRRVTWTDVARVLKQTIGGAQTDQGLRARLLRKAASASGYTTGALRRFLNTFDYLESIPEDIRPDEKLANESFTAIEMIQRIASHDEQEAVRLLGEFRTSKVPVSKLRLALKDSKERSLSKGNAHGSRPVVISESRSNPGSSSASERNWRVNAGLRLLNQLLPQLTGKYESFQQPLGNAPVGVRCDAIAWLDGKWTKGDGFELVHAPVSVSKSVVSDRVTRAIVASRFFRRFHLVFTPDSGFEQVHRAAQALDQLDVRSVGVVWLQAEKPLIRARSGPPSPDWTDKLAKVCPRGKWDENFSLRPPRR
jgi:hypothetical protein